MTIEKPYTLDEKIFVDVIWEQTTPLKGWAKTKAFIERVFKDREKPKEEVKIIKHEE